MFFCKKLNRELTVVSVVGQMSGMFNFALTVVVTTFGGIGVRDIA